MKACSLHFMRLNSSLAQKSFVARSNPQVPAPPPANAYSPVVDRMVYSKPEKTDSCLQRLSPNFGSGGDGRWEEAEEIGQDLLFPSQGKPAPGLSINGYYLAPDKVAQLAAGGAERGTGKAHRQGTRGDTLADQLERIRRDADAEISEMWETTRKNMQQSNANHFRAVMELMRYRPLKSGV